MISRCGEVHPLRNRNLYLGVFCHTRRGGIGEDQIPESLTGARLTEGRAAARERYRTGAVRSGDVNLYASKLDERAVGTPRSSGL